LSCSVCGSPRGLNIYCWNCGQRMPDISIEDLLQFELRRERKEAVYGCCVTVNGVLQGGNGTGGKNNVEF
jgi:hypothetical protein